MDGVSLLSQADFGLAVKNWEVPGKKRGEPGNWWLSHPGRREYSNIDFNPGSTREGEYNFWQGFPVLGQARDCHLFWRFVQDVICAGSESYQYLRRYGSHGSAALANAPKLESYFAVDKGTGKNTFVEALGSLVAPSLHDRKSLGPSHRSIQRPLDELALSSTPMRPCGRAATNTRLGN